MDVTWKKVEKETGFSKELYARAVIDFMKEKGLIEHFSLFIDDREADSEYIENFSTSYEPPVWYLKNCSEISFKMQEVYGYTANFIDEENRFKSPEVTDNDLTSAVKEAILEADLLISDSEPDEDGNFEKSVNEVVDDETFNE